MRLGKYLAHSGIASRRGSEKLILAGRVSIAGVVVTDPARDVDDSSGVEIDGSRVEPEPTEVWALNKPAGVVSTAKEPGKRRAVVELVKSSARLYPVGRLDAESTGLILLTNDGALANKLTHPRYEVPKTYRVSLAKPPSDVDVRRLRQGVTLDDGPTAPARIRRSGERELEITIHEGRNRQVRRMVEAVGNRAEALTRIRFGSLQLGQLAEGESRRLSAAELKRLWKDAAS
ncbi:MAG: pseudouridine synthase [Solirubrobacterales bacterium]